MENYLDRYIGAPCEIKSEQNQLLATGLVAGHCEDELVVRDPHGSLTLEHYNRPVKIYLHSAECGGRELMGKVYISTNSFMRIRELHLLAGEEQRSSFRLSVSLDGQVCRSGDIARAQAANKLGGGSPAALRLSLAAPAPSLEKPAVYTVKIADLSAGGASVSGKVSFKKNEKFTLSFSLNGRPAELTCTAVRDSGKADENGICQTGCRFVSVTAAQSDALCFFLLQEQGRLIRKSKKI